MTQVSHRGRLLAGLPVSGKAAFTLVEVVIAVGIVSLAGLSLIAALAQSEVSGGELRSRDAAHLAVEGIREGLQSEDFESIYQEIVNEPAIRYAYLYKGDLEYRREDGTPRPAEGSEGSPTFALRSGDDPELQEDLPKVQGEVFRVRLTLYEDGSNSDVPLPPTSVEYREAVLRVFVEIYRDPTPLIDEGEWIENRKVLSYPLSISR
ncbi:MAG: hypothetical protein CMO55_07630 [Verrucomicrobiales bacterium]|nr:hypothetical protein [Verrucomicrobiales bacterium]